MGCHHKQPNYAHIAASCLFSKRCYYFLPAKAKFTFLPPALFDDVSNVANYFAVVEVV